MAPRSRNALQIFGTGGFGLVINNQSSAFGISGLHATSAILIARSQTTGIFHSGLLELDVNRIQ